MRVLVVGGGAREHALCRALSIDPSVTALTCAPGNPGIAVLAEVRSVDPLDPAAVAEVADAVGADLVVIGPEASLVAGVADAVRAIGIACFGPSRDAARLEGSKAFAKEVMAAGGVPTARSFVCETTEEVAAALDAFGPPYVVKNDALAAGKGVVVTQDRHAAIVHATGCHRVVVEEYLAGPEVSLFAVCDGESIVPLQLAQDFKRVGDGDTGLNTGGMGAYSPLPWAPAHLVDDMVRYVVQPTLDEMRRRGAPFAGLLYAGLALTSGGAKVIEFNVRFGDPEAQVVLARLRTPLAGLLYAAATGRLAESDPLRWQYGAAVTVVVAAENYPAAPRVGDLIEGIAEAEQVEGAFVLHGGTNTNVDGRLVSAGGRVLSVTATGPDLASARQRAYMATQCIQLEGRHYRTDIALAAEHGQVLTPDSPGHPEACHGLGERTRVAAIEDNTRLS
jgi:phosphoribosylamine---glycine ligase